VSGQRTLGISYRRAWQMFKRRGNYQMPRQFPTETIAVIEDKKERKASERGMVAIYTKGLKLLEQRQS